MSGAARLDKVLVERGFFASRARARAAIEAGNVRVDGVPAAKPGQLVAAGARLEAAPAHPWVSRGGVKLAHGLDAFGVDPAGRLCLDVGASTGGFTQVLLARGAACVVAVDVGRGQLSPTLRDDARVISMEGRDARSLTPADLPAAPTLVTCDASFIGLAKVLPAALRLTAPDAELVALFKPQFEVGRPHVGKGGVVRDEEAVSRALAALRAFLTQAGWLCLGEAESPIAGGDGNRELLIHARRGSGERKTPAA